MRSTANKKIPRFILITGLVIFFVLVMATPVTAATNGSVIEQGATVFIGESGLNVANALNAVQGLPIGSTPTNTVIGWWASSAVIGVTSPTKTIDLATRYTSMQVAPTDFVGYTGNWYLVNPATGFAITPSVFTVADPSLSTAVWDFSQASDVTGNTVPRGNPLGFQINTNMYAAVDGRYRSNPTANGGTFPNPATDGYITIKVKDANGVTYSTLQVGAPGTAGTTTSLLKQFVNTQPWYFGSSATNAWVTDATDNNNQYLYPVGTYSVWAESTLNNMKENYKNAGADYVGKSVSAVGTVILSGGGSIVSFTGTPTSGPAPLTVTFTDTGSTSGSETYNFVTNWGTQGTTDGQFDLPVGVALDSSGNIYVAEYGNNRIQKFNSNGTFITKWGTFGSSDGQFLLPHGVAVDSSSNVYVADLDNNRIQKFSYTGAFITKWGTEGTVDGQFQSPYSVAVDSSGNVYVSDYGNNRIQKFSSNGTFITKWGSQGRGDGQFNAPSGVAVDSSGNVYVADYGNNRIQKFSSTGTFMAKMGSYGSGDGQFHGPYGVAVDSSRNLFITDLDNNRIQKFSSTGAFITKWGSYGSGDGQFQGPYGVAIDSSGNVYVADLDNNRIQKFASSTTSWSWNFGDSSSVNATQQNPVHTYTSVGTYTVALNVTNSAGSNIFTRTNYITVTSPTTTASSVGVFRSGTFHLNGATSVAYGMAGDTPVTGDWNGDGLSEVGVFRSGTFYRNGATSVAYGMAGDTPVTGDWNGDGTTEVGVFRSGTFHLNGATSVAYGMAGDTPVTGDWNGDGMTEVGVFRSGTFYRNGATSVAYGIAGDTPVTGDWNGDGMTEVGVFGLESSIAMVLPQ